ncbi:MAG: hypothetical protein FWC80_03455 [Firmicutes bacterium]|nr:hypothetical protein [Bacillota bacterium]
MANNNSQEFLKFDAACGEMAHGKYILAEKKVAGILASIATSERLTAIVGKCVADFDFGTTFKNAQTIDFHGRSVLTQMGERKDAIAFVFCLLMEIDTGKRNFIDFLSTFYYSDGDMHDAYKAFCSEQIIPFAINMRETFEGGDALLGDPVAEVASSQQWQAEPNTPVRPQPTNNAQTSNGGERLKYDTTRDMLDCATAISDEVSKDSTLSKREREELTMLLDALISAIQTRNVGYTKILFIGAKNTAACSSASKRLFPLFENLFRILKATDIL